MGYKAVAINAGCLKIKEIDSYHNQSNLTISSAVKIVGNVNIEGAVVLGSGVQNQVKDSLEVKGGATLNGNLNLAGNLNIGGPAGDYTNSVLVVKHPYPNEPQSIATSRVGINTDAPKCLLDVNGVDAIKIPVGTTNDRPTPVTGMIRYNTDLTLFEGYGGTAWGSLGGAIDIDQDTDISTDTYFEGTPVGQKDDDIIRLRNRNLQTMMIDHTGKVGIGDESHFHPSVPESEIRDAWVLDKIVNSQYETGLNVDNKTPSDAQYKNIYEGNNADGTSTDKYNAFSASFNNLETWATLDHTEFVNYVVPANPTIGIPDAIHYDQKTTNDTYGTAEEFINQLPQSSLDVRGNVSVSQNLNVNGYVMIPIDQKLYLTENKQNYLTVKPSSDDGSSTNNLEIKSTEGDINLFAGGDINIPTNIKLNFGNNNELKDTDNNFNIKTDGDLTFTNDNHTITSSGNNSIIANASKIQLNSSSNTADSLHLNSTSGSIKLDTPNDVAVNTNNFTVTSSNNTTLTSSNDVLIKSENSTANTSIQLESTSGSVLLKSSKKMNLTSGQINLTSKQNISNAIQIVTDGGTSETLLIKNTQGTHDDDAIKIESAAGGVKVQSQKNIDIESETQNIEFRVKHTDSKFVFKNDDDNELINIEQNGRVQFLNTDVATVTNNDHKNVNVQSFTVTDAPFNVNGSAHISKNIFVNESVYINGNLNVKGDITQINTDQLVVDDPLIVLGLNQTTSNREHSGIMNRYKDGNDNKFTGLVRVPGASLQSWDTQVSTPTSQSGSFHLFTNTASHQDDENHPDIQDNNYDTESKHSDLHLKNIMLLGTGDVVNKTTTNQAALQVKGGACIGEKLHIGSTSSANEQGGVRGTNASLIVQGGISLAENIYMNKNKKIQWSDGEHLKASGTELNLTGHKICLKTDDGGNKDTSGNIRFKYNDVEAYSFDNHGRVKSNQNFVLDVNGNINLDVPDSTKKVLFSCNETNFLSINKDGSKSVISNESNGSIDIQHSDSTIMSFKSNKVELKEGSQLIFNTNNYLTYDNSILKFNYDTLNFVNSTNILELTSTSATLQKPLYLVDNTNSINVDSNNKLVLNSNTGIDYKINNTSICDINDSTFNIRNKKIKFDSSEIYESNNALNIKTNINGTIKLDTTNINIKSNSKLILGNKNNYITSNGTDLKINSSQSDLTLQAGTSKKIIMNSASNIELTAGMSSRGVVKVTNTADDALTVEGGVNVAQDVVVQGELQSHGPLQLNHNLYYVPEIINYENSTTENGVTYFLVYNDTPNPNDGNNPYGNRLQNVDGQYIKSDGAVTSDVAEASQEHIVTTTSGEKEISSNTVLTVININSLMSDNFYLELGNGSYNGQIKKLVLHPNYQQNKDTDSNGVEYVVNVDIDKFCDPDGNRIDDATIILNRGGQSVNLIWVMDDGATNDGYYLLLDNNFDFN